MSNTITVIHLSSEKETFYINKGNCYTFNNITVNFVGDNAHLIFYGSTQFRKTKFVIGENCSISIKESSHLISNLSCYAVGDNTTIAIGSDFSCYGTCLKFYDKNSELVIGDDCMFSLGIYIWGTDGHTIYDINTMQCINGSQRKIFIGNHVWIGFGCTILKGSYISDNCVVGARSLVCSTFLSSNNIIAGSPARILRANINWARERVDEFCGIYPEENSNL